MPEELQTKPSPTPQYSNINQAGVSQAVPNGAPIQIQGTPSDITALDQSSQPDGVMQQQNYDFMKRMNDYTTILGEHFNTNAADLEDDFRYFNVVQGKATYEQVFAENDQAKVNRTRADRLKAVESRISPDDWLKYMYPLVDSLPYMKRLMEATAAGSAVTGLGAAAGGSLLGPGVAGVAGGMGLVFGGPAAAFTFAAAQGSGKKYKELRAAGLPHEAAQRFAVTAGIKHGIAEGATAAISAKLFVSTFGEVLRTPYGKSLVKNAIAKFALSFGGQATLEGLEEAADELGDLIIDDIAGKQYKKPALLHSDAEWAQRIATNFAVGALLGGGMHVAVSGAGKLTGKMLEKAIKNKGTMETTGKANWADDMRTVLKAYKEVEAKEMNPDLPPPVATTLKQALEQGAAAKAKTLKGVVEQTETLAPEAVKKEVSNLEEAQGELKDAKEQLKEARKTHAAAAEAVRNNSDETQTKTLEAAAEKTAEEVNSALDNFQAAKLGVEKWQLTEQLNSADLTDQARADLEGHVDALRAKHRELRKKQAYRDVTKSLNEAQAEITKANTDKKQRRKEYDATKKQIATDAKNGKITPEQAADKQAKAKEKFNKDIDALDARITKANENVEDFSSLKHVIESDLLNVREVNALRVQLKATDVTEVVNLAVKQLGQLSRAVAWNTRKQIKKNQDILTKIIKRSGLDAADKAIFYAQVKNIQSSEDLKKFMEDTDVTTKHKDGTETTVTEPGLTTKINALLEVRAKERALTRLQGVLESTKPLQTDSGKQSKFSFLGTTQSLFDMVSAMVNPPRQKGKTYLETQAEAVRQAQQEYADALAAVPEVQGNNPLAAMNAVDPQIELAGTVADLVGELRLKTAEEIEKLSDVLEGTAKDGRLSRIEDLIKIRGAIADAQTKVLTAIYPDKTSEEIEQLVRPTGALVGRDHDSAWNAIQRKLKSTGKTEFSWEGKLDILLQKLKPEDRKELKDLLDTGSRENKKMSLSRLYKDILADKVFKHTGMNTKEWMKWSLAAVNREIEFQHTDLAGKVQLEKMTLTEAIDLHLMLGDSDLRKGLNLGNGFTFEKSLDVKGNAIPYWETTQGALEHALVRDSHNNLKVAAALSDYYKEMYHMTAKEFRKATGLTLAESVGYSGNARRARTEFSGTTNEMIATLKKRYADSLLRTAKPGMVKLRQDSSLSLHVDNAVTKATAYADQLAHWQAWREQSNFIASVLQNPDLKAAIKIEYGEGFYNALGADLHDMAVGTVQRQADWQKHLDAMMARMGPLVLLGKPLQFPKQVISGFASLLLEMNGVDLARGMIEFHTSTKPWQKMKNSEEFKNRYENDYHTWMGAMVAKDPGITRDGNINKVLGLPLVGGDMYLSSAGAWAKYQADLRAKVPEAEAMKNAWDLIERTQSSGRKDQIGLLAKNPVFKMISLFLEQPKRAGEYRLTAARDFVNHPSPGSAYKMLRTEFITRAAQVLFVLVDALMLEWFCTDEKKREKAWQRVQHEMYFGPMGALGSTVSYLAMVPQYLMTGEKERQSLPEHPFFNSIEYVQKYNEDLVKVMESGDWSAENAIILASDFAKGYYRLMLKGPKIPIEPTINMLKGYFNISSDSIEEDTKITW